MDKPQQDIPVITVDGPGGVGKGTVSRMLARRLGWHLLDSGALYRLVGLAALGRDLPLDAEPALEALARDLDARFDEALGRDQTRVLLEGRDVSAAIRSEACGAAASKVAAVPGVRRALLERQRAFRRPPGLIADGRDMGTAVFPDATLKIYLDASVGERAKRRYKQLKDKGMNVRLEPLLREIEERDARDSARRASPMKPAPGARVIDTTALGIDEVVDAILTAWRACAEREGT